MTLSRLAMVRGSVLPDHSPAGALDEAYFAVTTERVRDVLPDPDSPLLVRQGWAGESYRLIAAWTEHADRIQSSVSNETVAGRGAIWLIQAGWNAAHSGATWAEAAPWLQVLAAAPLPDDHKYRLRDMLLDWDEGGDSSAGEWTRTVGDLAALAWAAGLSIEEAGLRHAGRTLEEAGLRTLAALNDYRLP